VTNIRISAHFTHLRKFRNFVFATEVTIFSDHNPLMYLRECAPKSTKLTRWALELQEFMHADCNIFHTSVDRYFINHNKKNNKCKLKQYSGRLSEGIFHQRWSLVRIYRVGQKRGHRLVTVIPSNLNRFTFFSLKDSLVVAVAVKGILKIPSHLACFYTTL